MREYGENDIKSREDFRSQNILHAKRRIQHSPSSYSSQPWPQKYQGRFLKELRGIDKIPRFDGENRQ